MLHVLAHSFSFIKTEDAPVFGAEQAATSTPIERRLGDDGVGYSWAEFADYYFDVDLAAAIWEAAEVDAAPELTPILTSPRFEPGSIVRVLADTTPGVHPMHAEGILVAKVLDFAFEGHYFERLTWFGLLNFSSPYLYLFVFKCKKKPPRMNNPSTELTFIPSLCLVI